MLAVAQQVASLLARKYIVGGVCTVLVGILVTVVLLFSRGALAPRMTSLREALPQDLVGMMLGLVLLGGGLVLLLVGALKRGQAVSGRR